MFWVKVPVLSEQIQDVEPSVSTDSKFLTRIFFYAILLAVKARETVTVTRSPSGTLATIIPIVNTKHKMIGYDQAIPKKKNNTPSRTAIIDMYLTNLFISWFKGDCSFFADWVRLAI